MVYQNGVNMVYMQILVFGGIVIIGMDVYVLDILMQLFFIVSVQFDVYFFVFQICCGFNYVFVIFFYQCLYVGDGIWGGEIVFFFMFVRDSDLVNYYVDMFGVQ